MNKIIPSRPASQSAHVQYRVWFYTFGGALVRRLICSTLERANYHADVWADTYAVAIERQVF